MGLSKHLVQESREERHGGAQEQTGCSQEWKTNEPRHKWMEKQKEEIPRTMRTIEGGAARTEAPGRGTSWGVVGLGSGAVSMQLGRRIFSPTPCDPVS